MTQVPPNALFSSRLRVRDVARVTNSSERTVRRWIAAGTLRSVKIGGIRLIDPADLERLLGGGNETFDDDEEGSDDDCTDISKIKSLSQHRESIIKINVPSFLC